MPEVSVIIPNYNHAPYLRQRIDSILGQTYQDIEIIILDDHSSDDSRKIIEQYKDHPKVSQVVFNENNSGSTFLQWKKGIGLAKGNWIWIAESDDWCETGFLETLLPGIRSGRCTIAYLQTLAFRGNEVILNSHNALLEEVLPGDEFIRTKMMEMNSIFNASMCVFSKRHFYNVSDRFMRYKFCGDWLFWIELAAQGDVYISARILNYFRKHDKDVSSDAFRSGLYYKEYLQLMDDLSELNIVSREREKQLVRRIFKKYYLDRPNDTTLGKVLEKDFERKLGADRYRLSAGLFFKRLWNKAFLISLAVRRRVSAGGKI